MLSALRHRDFRLFWAGQLVSLTGTWMQSVAQSWLVLELTGSPFLLGLVSAAQFAPMLVLSFPAGALVDRLPKRRLVIASQSLLFAQSLTLALLVHFGHVRYWHVAVLALAYGIANTVDMPSRQSFIVDMVGKEDLVNAIAINSATFNAARIVGPAVAGLLIARHGTGAAFFINAASFVPVIAALLAVRAEGRPRAVAGRRLWEEIAEGIAYAAGTPRIILTLTMVMAVSAFLFNYGVVVPLLARDVLHQEAHGFGLLMAALGTGALGGALALAVWRGGRLPVAALATPALVLAATTVAIAGVSRVEVAALLLLVMGFCGILFMAGSNSTLQMIVPDALRGRVMSLHMLMFAGITPFGALLVGSLAEGLGVRTCLMVSGSAGLGAIVLLLGWWHLHLRSSASATP